MTDNLPEQEQNAAAELPETTAAATPAPEAAAADAAGNAARRGGRNRRGGARGPANTQAAAQQPVAVRRTHPLLEKLAELYPQLFGAVFLPLKRGIFQDLLAAHPEALDRDELKQALAIHTRSTRYLHSVAAGEQRHDLQGQAVEAMAPEHIHHALIEVFRRRKPRDGEDLRAKLRQRMVRAFEASGLTREAYAELVTNRDVAHNSLLEEALQESAERSAKTEALLRAFEASGNTVAEFADMYGMDPRQVAQMLEHARRSRDVAAKAAAAAAAAEAASAAADEAAQDNNTAA